MSAPVCPACEVFGASYLEERASSLPEPVGLNIPLASTMFELVGRLVTQWGALEPRIDFELAILGRHPNVPPELRESKLRREFNHRVSHLQRVAPYALADARPHALKLYLRTLSKICRVKGIRDAIVHGGYPMFPDARPDVLRVEYKGKVRSYTAPQIAQAIREVSHAGGFLLEFMMWQHAPEALAQHRTWLQEFHEQGHPDTMIATVREPEAPSELTP